MDRSLIRKLEMATRVQEFQRAHPYTDKNQAAIAAQFEAKLAEAQSHSYASQEQQTAADAAKQQRHEIRRNLEAHLLQGIARIGTFALRDDARTASRFVVPKSKTSNAAFLVQATSLLEVARENQDTLIRHGLPRGQVGELAAALGELRAAAAQVQASEREQRESRTACATALDEALQLVEVLDAFNRGRFQDDAAMLRMWSDLRTIERPATPRIPRDDEGATEDQAEPAAAAENSTDPPAAPGDGQNDPGANRAA